MITACLNQLFKVVLKVMFKNVICQKMKRLNMCVKRKTYICPFS